ncbi:MAG: hypothetical protein QW244_01505 [Candidatus Pacearchaeota archaeon]
MRKEVLAAILAFFILLINAKAQIYLGVADGFVFYSNGTNASNAIVNILIINCTAPSQYCNRQTLTQDNGYYIVANLALEPYSYGEVEAKKGNFYARGIGQADEYGVLSLNLTLCEAPSVPILQPVNNFHPMNKTYNVTFAWTSGIDPNGLPTYDMFYLDGIWQNITSPATRINLAIGFHEWKVKTCNTQCCSDDAYDNFTILNSIPTTPVLIDQQNTNNNTVLLQWQNSSDSDNDPISYDFMIDSELRENVTSPQLVEGLSFGLHEWKVRACDFWQCSDWATDTFSVQNLPCPKPNLTVIQNVCNEEVRFEWQSANFDSEGQACYDEFKLEGVIESNVTSPKILVFNETRLVKWAVRSCDISGACSGWQESSFIYCECPSYFLGRKVIKACEIKEAVAIEGYELTILAPKKIYQGEQFEIEIDFVPLQDLQNLLILIEKPRDNESLFNLSQEVVSKKFLEKKNLLKTIINVSSEKEIKKGTYDFWIRIIANDTRIVYKKIPIEIKEIPFILKVLPTEKPAVYPYAYQKIFYSTLILTAIFIAIIIYKIVRMVYKIKRKR